MSRRHHWLFAHHTLRLAPDECCWWCTQGGRQQQLHRRPPILISPSSLPASSYSLAAPRCTRNIIASRGWGRQQMGYGKLGWCEARAAPRPKMNYYYWRRLGRRFTRLTAPQSSVAGCTLLHCIWLLHVWLLALQLVNTACGAALILTMWSLIYSKLCQCFSS